MHSLSATPWRISSYYPIPKIFYTPHLHLPTNSSYHLPKSHFTLTATTNSCSKEQERQRKDTSTQQNPYEKDHSFLQDFYSSIDTQKSQDKETVDSSDSDCNTHLGISTSMWWAEFKAALGQRINLEGITYSVGILAKDKQLVIPHVSVPDIRYIDWGELKRRGFKGVVFDKDNTITAPYSLSLWPPLGSSLEDCKSHFGNNIAVFSNSAGLYEYDRNGEKARALESAIGIKVIRHGMKKPAGTAEEVERHFSCESSRLIMVGDRPFTDVVYGNRNGFLTILTKPLSLAEEPLIVQQVRKVEVALVKRFLRDGLKASSHGLLPCPEQCVRDEPL